MNQSIDMRQFARGAGATSSFSPGSVVFNKGDPGQCMYIVQSGVIEMVIGDKVIEVVGPNEAIGFMSMIDGAARSSTARVKEACELSLIDAGILFCGTPDQVYAQITDFCTYCGGMGNLLMMGHAGFLSHEDTVSNLEIFSKEVMPRLKAWKQPVAEEAAA